MATPPTVPPTRGVTLREIARVAGVSVGAASYALNGRPGVSDETRVRILAIAHELGWAPNPAARALRASKANAIGFATVRPPGSRTVDTYLVQLLSGLEGEASRAGKSLVLHLAESEADLAAVYRTWWAGTHVDGIVLIDLVDGDPRLDAVRDIGVPAVVISGVPGLPDVSTVVVDELATARQVIPYLWALGHRRIARVAGVAELAHTRARTSAISTALADIGVDAGRLETIHTDYSAQAGQDAVRRLLSAPSRPTAIVFDNDVMAAASLMVVEEMSLRVPDDVSIVAWDDSDLCTMIRPGLTAVAHDPAAQGSAAVRLLLAQLESGDVGRVVLPEQRFTIRGSTAPVRS